MTTRAGSRCLDGGRRLTYSEAGPADGTPVVYCHGVIGTPLRDTVDVPGIAAELGVRRIALNRPGIGGSDLLHGRRIAGFVDDIAAVERERAAVATSFLEATAYGVRGMVEDYLTYSRSWGFSPAEVTADVQIWHGARPAAASPRPSAA